jgi:hypothetical protein
VSELKKVATAGLRIQQQGPRPPTSKHADGVLIILCEMQEDWQNIGLDEFLGDMLGKFLKRAG